jgi:mRNA interferase MazF
MSAIPQTPNPRRGEVWRVQLDPTRGSEQAKTRPVVVLSEPPAGRATMRLCAPIMNALPVHGAFFWCVGLAPEAANGLTKESTADAAQTRALDVLRFEARLGAVRADELELIADALIRCVRRPPTPPASPTP